MRSNAVTLDSKSHYNKAAQAYQVVCTMGFNTRSLKKAAFEQVAWMDTSSLVGQGLHHDQTTARNLASAALLDALSAREANWYAAAEHNDHHVADVGHGRTRRASSTARHELKNLQSRNDLLKFEYSAERVFTLWRGNVELHLPPGTGHLPAGVHVPAGGVMRASVLSSQQNAASSQAAQLLLEQVTRLGLVGKIPGLSKVGLIKYRYQESVTFWELLCNKRPQMEIKAEKKNVFTTTFSPSVSTKAISQFDDAPFEVTAPRNTQKKSAEMLGSVEASDAFASRVTDPTEAAQVRQLYDMNKEAFKQGNHLSVLQLPTLHEHLEGSIRNLAGSLQIHQARVQEEQERAAVYLRKQSNRGEGTLSHRGGGSAADADAAADPGASEARAAFDEELRAENRRRQAGIPEMMEARAKLPILELREKLLDTLATEQVVVISGGTGSGKTTQIPQYILDAAIEDGQGSACRMVCTQPRRIAATSVAKRVAEERGEEVGESTGYSVRMQSRAPRKYGSIEFCTTGVLLKRLQRSSHLQDIKYIIIDEVHERDINTDFLLLLMKDLLKEQKDLKLILMSATLDASGFSKYFNDAPLVDIPSAPRFPVEEYYLEDLEAVIGNQATTRKQVSTMLSAEQQHVRLEINQLMHDNKSGGAAAVGAADKDAGADDGFEDEDEDDAEGDAVGEPEDTAALSADKNKHEWETSANYSAPRLDKLTAIAADLERLNASTSAPGKGNQLRQDSEGLLVGVINHIVKQQFDKFADVDRVEAASQGEGTNVEDGTDGHDGEPLDLPSVQPLHHMGSILCFLPGWDEIKSTVNNLQQVPGLAERALILPLHGSLTQEEQQLIFEPAPPGKIKIIVSTNIAESSVTISDAIAIVDTGKVKEMQYDSRSGMSSLELSPASKANVTQRKGRTGRVAPGSCYRLYSRPMFEAIPERPVPEIQRMDLQHTCLQAKVLLPTFNVQEVLGRAMDPPTPENVGLALKRLQCVGAITTLPPPQFHGQDSFDDASRDDENEKKVHETVTRLGLRLAAIPVEPAVGRMLLYGVLFKCFDPILTAAVCAGARNPFIMSPLLREKSQASQRSFHSASDVEAKIQSFNQWSFLKREYGFKYASDWAYDNMLLLPALLGIEAEKKSLTNQLGRVIPNNIRLWGRETEEPGGVNMRANDEELRAALLLSGRGSKLAVKRRTQPTGFNPGSEYSAMIHPSSVNVQVARGKVVGKYNERLLARWLSYGELASTSDTAYLRDTTFASEMAIMLFGGLDVQPLERGGVSGIMDDWILCRGDQLDYQLMTTLRKELDCVLLRWLRQGRRDELSGQELGRQEAVLQTCVDALHYHGRHPSVMQRPRNPNPLTKRGYDDVSEGFGDYD